MRVLPAHAPQDRSYRLAGGDEAARHARPVDNSPLKLPCLPRRTKCSGARDAWSDRPAAKGPLTELQRQSHGHLHADCRANAARGPRHFSLRLVNPGLPGKPFVVGLADRTEGAREKHRAASKPFPIRFHACRDSAPGLGAFDHDDAHFAPPSWIFCAGGMSLRHRLECAPSRGGACSSRSRRAAKGSNED